MVSSAQRGTIGLTIFIATEVMFFAGLLSAYWVLRTQVVPWPPLGQPRYPVMITALNTLILLASAGAIIQTKRRRDHVSLWLALAGIGGLVFLLIQGYEWVRLIHFGMTAVANVYGGIFYLLVGAHAIHVVVALVVLGFVFVKAIQGAYAKDTDTDTDTGLRLCRLYWLFVVLLWPVIYVALYIV